MKRGFVTGGYWCVDRNMTLPAWPKEDTATHILDINLANGGSGSNLAIDIRKLDNKIPVETISLIGNDDNGKYLLELTERYQIKNKQLYISKDIMTPVTDSYQSLESGLRTHITQFGTASYLTPDYFNLEKTTAKIFHAGLLGIQKIMDEPWQNDENGWTCVLKKAKKSGLLTNIELITISPEKLRKVALPCLPYLDILVVNDSEIGALANIKTNDNGKINITECKEAIKKVLNLGSMEVVVVHFVEGCLLLSKSGDDIFMSSVNVPNSEKRGANGAGDAFTAGFLYGFHENWNYEKSLKLAHATAASSLRSTSTVETVGTVEENLKLAEKWGFRN